MNMREAFEACFYKREGHPPSQMNIADIAAWQGFQMGAAFAARECAGEADKLAVMANNPDSVNPDRRSVEWRDWNDLCPASMLRVKDAIREAFPEAFRD